jgi:hypothetical protein
MDIFPIQNVIPEANIVMFAPHYDDFLLGLGGYVLELREQDLLSISASTCCFSSPGVIMEPETGRPISIRPGTH